MHRTTPRFWRRFEQLRELLFKGLQNEICLKTYFGEKMSLLQTKLQVMPLLTLQQTLQAF